MQSIFEQMGGTYRLEGDYLLKIYPEEWTAALVRQALTSPTSGQLEKGASPRKGQEGICETPRRGHPGTTGQTSRNPYLWTIPDFCKTPISGH